MLMISGTKDPMMPYEGGKVAGKGGKVIGAEQTMALWQQLEHCTSANWTTPTDQKNDGTSLSILKLEGCNGNLELDKVSGAGHRWYGAGGSFILADKMFGQSSTNINVTSKIISFWDLDTSKPAQPSTKSHPLLDRLRSKKN